MLNFRKHLSLAMAALMVATSSPALAAGKGQGQDNGRHGRPAASERPPKADVIPWPKRPGNGQYRGDRRADHAKRDRSYGSGKHYTPGRNYTPARHYIPGRHYTPGRYYTPRRRYGYRAPYRTYKRVEVRRDYRHDNHSNAGAYVLPLVALGVTAAVLASTASRDRSPAQTREVVYMPPPQAAPAPVAQATLPPTSGASTCQMTREYQTEIVVGGQVMPAYGQACLQPDGSWYHGPAAPEPGY